MYLFKKTKYNVKYLLSKTIFRDLLEKYRHMGLNGNEIFLVSYQNSGSTWLRNLIYEVLTGNHPGEIKSQEEFPFVGKHKKTSPLRINKHENKKIIKSHSPYRKEYRGKKIIYIVRDPRDVIVSKYRKRIKQKYNPKNKKKEVDLFVRGKIVSEGKWNNHVRSWMNAYKKREIKLIT